MKVSKATQRKIARELSKEFDIAIESISVKEEAERWSDNDPYYAMAYDDIHEYKIRLTQKGNVGYYKGKISYVRGCNLSYSNSL